MNISPPLKLENTDIDPLAAMNIGGKQGCHWIHIQLFSLMKVIRVVSVYALLGWLLVALGTLLAGWIWAAVGMLSMGTGAIIAGGVFYWQLKRIDAVIWRQEEAYWEAAHALLRKE